MDMYIATMMSTTSMPLSMDIMLTHKTLQFCNPNLKQCPKITDELFVTRSHFRESLVQDLFIPRTSCLMLTPERNGSVKSNSG